MSQNQFPYTGERTSSPLPTNTPHPLSGVGASPAALGVKPDARLAAAFLSQAFLWMFVGLLVTAAVAAAVQSNQRLLDFAAGGFFPLLIAQLAIVVVISAAINRLNATLALALFFVYAATLGITIGLIVSSYTQGSVATAFLSASAMFGAAAVYGKVTQRSLAGIGGFLIMGVVGLLVAMLVNLFVGSSTITWIISIVGVVIFTALTAYDVQRIQSGAIAARTGSMEKAAVIGALQLYLDFVNLFLFMLRLMGGRNYAIASGRSAVSRAVAGSGHGHPPHGSGWDAFARPSGASSW